MMLWALLKIVIFFTIAAALTFGAGFVTELGGDVRIDAYGWEFTLSPLASVIGLGLLFVLVWLVVFLFGILRAFIRFLLGDETALSRYFDRNRERRGFEALSEGMMALAAGEPEQARSKAAKAERLLGRPDLTRLLTAQAAEASGDKGGAIAAYKDLLEDDRTRFAALHGLLRLKLAQGETDKALKLAEKAFALRPRHEGVQDTLFRLQTGGADWASARETLRAKVRARSLPRDVHARRDAVLALADAQEKAEAGDRRAAGIAAIEANKLSPALVPAAVLAARAHLADGAERKAAKAIKAAWTAQPHPDLAAAFAEIEPGETPAQRLKRFEQLLKIAPDHAEARLLRAELALAAEDFPAARRALGDMADSAPSLRVFTLMAAAERGMGAPDREVRAWLARALNAPRGPQWLCTSCNHIHAGWQPVCENCGSFDTLDWRDPPKTDEPGQAVTAALLPLIVGSLEEDREEETPEAENPQDATATAADPAPEAPAESAAADLEGIVQDAPVLPEDAQNTHSAGR